MVCFSQQVEPLPSRIVFLHVFTVHCSTFKHLEIWFSVCFFVSLSLYLSIYVLLSIYLFIYPSIYQCCYLSIFLFLSLDLLFCLSRPSITRSFIPCSLPPFALCHSAHSICHRFLSCSSLILIF